MSRVFISYQHEDTAADTGRLYDTLVGQLSAQALFKDVANVAFGENWKRAVREALGDSAAVLVVMGPSWSVSEALEFELEIALASNIPVIPVLVRNANIVERTSGLRGALASLSERKAFILYHDDSWQRRCSELADLLKRILADPNRARVIIEPPDSRALLDENMWPSLNDEKRLLEVAEDLAECLDDPSIREKARRGHEDFRQQVDDSDRSRHAIPPDLVSVVQNGLERLSIEQSIQDLLNARPDQKDAKGLVAYACQLAEFLGDTAVADQARKEYESFREEVDDIRRGAGNAHLVRLCQDALNEVVDAAMNRLKSETPGITKRYPKRTWPGRAFGTTRTEANPLFRWTNHH